MLFLWTGTDSPRNPGFLGVFIVDWMLRSRRNQSMNFSSNHGSWFGATPTLYFWPPTFTEHFFEKKQTNISLERWSNRWEGGCKKYTQQCDIRATPASVIGGNDVYIESHLLGGHNHEIRSVWQGVVSKLGVVARECNFLVPVSLSPVLAPVGRWVIRRRRSLAIPQRGRSHPGSRRSGDSCPSRQSRRRTDLHPNST